MSDSDLLKEIAYLSRLIGKHTEPSSQNNYRKKECLQQQKVPDGTFTYLKNEKIVRTVQTSVSNAIQADKHTSLNSSRMAVGDSKVIFINPERLKMSPVNKSVVSNRVVIPQHNRGNSEIQNNSARKVFINPNFKQSIEKKICEKTPHSSLPCNTSQCNTTSNTFVKSRIINLNSTNSLEKVPGNKIENSRTIDGFKVDDKTNNQPTSSKRIVVKPQSCYVNPHFKGLSSQKPIEFKEKLFVQNMNLKNESNSHQTPRRIVKIVSSIPPSANPNKPHVNTINNKALLQNSDNSQISPAEQKLNPETNVKLEALKKKKEVLAFPKTIQNSSSCQQKEKTELQNSDNSQISRAKQKLNPETNVKLEALKKKEEILTFPKIIKNLSSCQQKEKTELQNSDNSKISPGEQKLNPETNVKLEALKKKKEILTFPKTIQNSSPCQQKEKMELINRSTLNQYQKNLLQRVNLKKADCNYLSQPGPSKIYVNKEKWKSNLLKLNKPTAILDHKIKGSKTNNDLEPGRNIYVNRILLTKTLKDNQLKNTMTVSSPKSIKVYNQTRTLKKNHLKESMAVLNPKNTRVYTQLPLATSPKSLKGRYKYIDSSKQLRSNAIKPRKRSSSSTCLVSISKTKMVRKNKPLVQVQPLKHVKKFEYLNKIKKLEIAKGFRNTRQVKRAITKDHFQYINPNKIAKLRKHSFVWTINNLVKMNLNYQKNKIPNTSYNFQPKLKEIVPMNKNEFKKSKYHLNKSKLNQQNLVKNLQIIKKLSPQKPAENACKGSNKLVRSNSSILMLSATKLVRKKLPALRPTPIQTRKPLHSVQLARLVKSKYKLNQTVSTFKKSHFTNRMDSHKKIIKNNPYSISTKRKTYSQKNSLSSLVNIGGVFYKATHNKLTRKSPISSKDVVNKGPVLQVRGQRFRLDKTGRTLMSLDQNVLAGVNKLRRVDIGGVTFIRSKQGTTLLRTNTHTARNRLIQAKQRSITLLTKNLRKNNQPCPLFHRFGRCAGKEKGTCYRIHNSNNIAICKKFVQGQCQNANCLLSHNIGPEKMPTCYHYLAGNCVRDNCPYLHVKVNSKAPVCVPFLQGYCADGNQCKKRHTNICPEFEEKGTCSKGKYCPYPHVKRKKKPKSKSIKRKKIEVEAPVAEVCKEEVSTCRYFDDERCNEKVTQDFVETDIQESVKVDDENSEWLVKRPKLGVLPAFIPLSMD